MVETAIQKERCAVILRSILRYARLTRTDLGRILKLSPGAVVKYVKILIDLGLIRETLTAESNGSGRKSVYLEFNPDKGSAVAVALYRTSIRAGILTTTGEILESRSYPYDEKTQGGKLLELLSSILDETVARARGLEPRRPVVGIGIAMGGHLDQVRGISHEYLFAEKWYSVPLKEIFEKRFACPVFLVKDSNACALGEQYYGNGVGVDDFLSVWLGDGIGMGIVIDGRNYVGAAGYAGEIGHTKGGDASKLCYCGKSGCIEGVCSQDFILERCRDGLRGGVMSAMRRLCDGDESKLAIEHVIAAASEGDRLSRSVFDEAAGRLSLALCDAANLFNPRLILLRGPLIDGNDYLFDALNRSVKNGVLHRISLALDVLHAPRDEGVHLKGLCSFVVNGLISDGPLSE